MEDSLLQSAKPGELTALVLFQKNHICENV